MLTSLVSSVVEFLTAHPHVAYLAVFLLALSESIPIIGVVIPGTAVEDIVPSSATDGIRPALAGDYGRLGDGRGDGDFVVSIPGEYSDRHDAGERPQQRIVDNHFGSCTYVLNPDRVVRGRPIDVQVPAEYERLERRHRHR